MITANDLAESIEAIVAAWDGGDLAQAVNEAQETAWQYRQETGTRALLGSDPIDAMHAESARRVQNLREQRGES